MHRVLGSCSPWPIENMSSVLYHQGLCLPCLCFFEKQKFIIGRRDRIGLLCVLFDRETNAIILPVSCAIRSEYWRVIKKIKWQTVYKMFNYKAKERMFQKHLHSVRSDRLFECQGWQKHTASNYSSVRPDLVYYLRWTKVLCAGFHCPKVTLFSVTFTVSPPMPHAHVATINTVGSLHSVGVKEVYQLLTRPICKFRNTRVQQPRDTILDCCTLNGRTWRLHSLFFFTSRLLSHSQTSP